MSDIWLEKDVVRKARYFIMLNNYLSLVVTWGNP